MNRKIISTSKIDNVKYLDHQQHAGIYCSCPDCNGDLVYGMVSCPDERSGCLVAHYGFGCRSCKSVFKIEFEKSNDDDQKQIFSTSEEIGVAYISTNAIKKLIGNLK